PSGNANVAYFDLHAYNRRMAADARLSGPARFRAFSQLDADIMRNQAPWAPIAEGSSWRFVSKRVRCGRLRPVLGLVYRDLCPLGGRLRDRDPNAVPIGGERRRTRPQLEDNPIVGGIDA